VNLHIDEAILKQTTKCPNEFKCLNRAEYPLCRAAGNTAVLDSGIFVIAPERNGCSYKLRWGDGHMCRCPVRMEIYQRYKK